MFFIAKLLPLFLTFTLISGQNQFQINLQNLFQRLGLGNIFGNTNPGIAPRGFSNTTQEPITFSYSEWGEFSTCDRVCGGGFARRSRRCMASDGRAVSRAMCTQRENVANLFQSLRNIFSREDITRETETVSCNEQDCAVSEWDEWGECSAPCGGGQQTSSRTCLDSVEQDQCNFQSFRTRTCRPQTCFRMGFWSEFGECNRVCGGGEMVRTRACEPAFDPLDPAYGELQQFLTQISSIQSFSISLFPLLASNERQQILIQQFTQTCATATRNAASCNAQACPSCPANQIYYTCKPCDQFCRRQSNLFEALTINTLGFGFTRLLTAPNSNGCNGACEMGCGCPALSPYLGVDGRCYSLEILCPINRFPENGGTFQSTEAPIVARATTLLTNPPPSTPTPPTTTTTTTTAEPLPRANLCEYDILIATSPDNPLSCVCFGELQAISCLSDDSTSCPVICRKDE